MAARPKLALAWHDDSLLEVHGVVFRSDMSQVAADGMAAGASARAVEIGLTRLCVADENIENLVGAALSGRAHAVMQKGGDIGNLLGRQRKLGHAFVLTAIQHNLADQFTVFIVQNGQGTKQIRTGLTAFGVPAMTECAIGAERLLATVKCRGIIVPVSTA